MFALFYFIYIIKKIKLNYYIFREGRDKIILETILEYILNFCYLKKINSSIIRNFLDPFYKGRRAVST